MSAAYLTQDGDNFIARLVVPGITDLVEELQEGDLLFDTIPFDKLKEGWWNTDGEFLGNNRDTLIGSNGQPI